MLDLWAEPSRHAMAIEHRPSLSPAGQDEYRHTCKCGYIGPTSIVILPLPGVCPVLQALQARTLGIAGVAREDQRERYERPRRIWMRLDP